MSKLLSVIISFLKVSMVFHVTKTMHIYVKSHDKWVIGKTDAPGWSYAVINGKMLVDSDNGVPMFARYEWAANGESKPPKYLRIHGTKYVRAYASQGNLKKGVAVYIRADVWKKLKKKLVMGAPSELVLTEAGKKEFKSAKTVQNKIAVLNNSLRKLQHRLELVDNQTDAMNKKRAAGHMSDSEFDKLKKELFSDRSTISEDIGEIETNLKKLNAYIELKQIGSRTRQKHGQNSQLYGTGVEQTGIGISDNAHVTNDDARIDKVEGFAEIDTRYDRITPVAEAKFCGMDGTGFLGANFESNVRATLERMLGKPLGDLVIKILQVRVWKGVMMVMRPVSEIAKDKGIELVPDSNGKPGIKMTDAYGNEFVFTDDSVVFTESMVKNKAFFSNWQSLVENLLVPEVLATNIHFVYNKVRLNRQFWELMMNQATDDEIAGAIHDTAKEIKEVGTGIGYVKEALKTVPEWSEIPSMRAAVLHPGLGMTINKKMWNKSHRAAAGKVTVAGDCLVAVPDRTYAEDYICQMYGFFADNGKRSGTLGKNANGLWEIRVPHATERGLIGKTCVLGRSPYVTPIAAIAVIVGDSFCDGVVEMPMQEGSPFAVILACDWDGDHVYCIYDQNVVNAAMRMNQLVMDCGGYITVFEDMPGSQHIKVEDEDEYMAEAMELSDVGLATTPIFKLASMVPVGAKPDDLIRTCNGNEEIRIRDIIWAMMMVNAAVTRAADAIKRGAKNGFNETENGKEIGSWTNGTEMSKIHDHCLEMLGVHTDETMEKMNAKEDKGNVGLMTWTESGIDSCNWILSSMLVDDPSWLNGMYEYRDVNIEEGGWITHPERGSDWAGYDWHRWTTVDPEETELNVDVSKLGEKLYVDLDGKKWVSHEEAIKMWTDGTEINLEGELSIALIYSRLYRNWQSASRKASDWKRKVDLTERARTVCYSIIKACYVEAYGIDDNDLDEYARRVLYNNLGSYFMSPKVTDTTADELRDWSRIPEFQAYMKSASDIWMKTADTEEDKKIMNRLVNFVGKIKTMDELDSEIKKVHAILSEQDCEEEMTFDAHVDTEGSTSEVVHDVNAFLNAEFDVEDEESENDNEAESENP